MTMKKHKDMKLIENKATVEMFDLIRGYKKEVITFLEMKQDLIKRFQKYNVIGWNNDTYYKEMIGHAEKNLKRENFIAVSGRGDNKVYKKESIKIPEPFENIDSSNIIWDTEQKISNIYDFVGSNKHLIPSFQRGTAWSKAKDYVELAYSIFRSVPLGIMYLWKIDKDKAVEIKHNKFKRDIKLNDTVLNFEAININELKDGDIYSVIDGQQRITGVNVIINGSFDGKKLYFNEKQPGSKKFKFFKKGDRILWNSVEDIYSSLLEIKGMAANCTESFPGLKSKEIKKLSEKMFISTISLESFYSGFFESELIAICELPNIELPEILQVFVRTNQFGKKLNPTDIMMSYIIGDDISTREKIVNLYKESKIFKSNMKLSTILKLVSVIFNDNATIQPSDFSKINKELIPSGILDVKSDKSWNKIINAFEQLKNITESSKFETKWIKSENSIIPIIYWIIYKNENRLVVKKSVKNEINNYLLVAQLSRVFRSSTDQRLNFIIKNLSDEFSGWKLGLEKKEASETIKSEIKTYKYGRNDSEIKILLSSIGICFDGSDSIEHLVAQNNGGSDSLYNLAILPKEINSEIKDDSLKSKIEYLAKRYEMKPEDILKKLHITDSEMEQEKILNTRLNKILASISKHL